MSKKLFKNIIALQGKANTGKTRTILYLIDIMKQDGWIELKRRPYKGKKKKYEHDESVLLCKNGKRVLITSAGDEMKYICPVIKHYTDDLKDICLFVCACRTDGKTVKFVESKSNNSYFVGREYIMIVHNKTKTLELRNRYDNEQAKHLYDLIKSVVKS